MKTTNTIEAAVAALIAAGYNAEATRDGLSVWGEGWSVEYSKRGQDYEVRSGKVPAEVDSLAVWDDAKTRNP